MGRAARRNVSSGRCPFACEFGTGGPATNRRAAAAMEQVTALGTLYTTGDFA